MISLEQKKAKTMNKAELKQHFKPCEWFEDKVHSGMRIGNTYYSLLRHQGKVHIYDATDKIYKLLLEILQ